MDDGVIVQWGGEDVLLNPDRTLYWPRRSLTCVADVHVGRVATYRAHGAPVPGDTLGDVLDALVAACRRHDPDRIVALGDFVHATEGLSRDVVDRVGETLATLPAPLEIVRGNHEQRVGRLPGSWRAEVVPPGRTVGPFALHHEPTEDTDDFALAGHLHPTAKLETRRDKLQCACFARRGTVGVLPAFHPMTNGVDLDPRDWCLHLVTNSGLVSVDRRSA